MRRARTRNADVRQKAEAGVTIAGVMDDEQVRSNQGTEYDPFRQADLDGDAVEAAVYEEIERLKKEPEPASHGARSRRR